jgi:hypothetical protein
MKIFVGLLVLLVGLAHNYAQIMASQRKLLSRTPRVDPDAARVSTPRRRLREALKLEEQVAEQLASEGWNTVKRGGMKIGSIYTLVSVCFRAPDVRISVSSFTHFEIKSLPTTDLCNGDVSNANS